MDDEKRGAQVKLVQARDGYRYSLDPVLLCGFAGFLRSKNILDLGTGCGVIPLLLETEPASRIVGVELQSDLASRARRNVELNGLADKVEILEADLREHRRLFSPQSFDAVLTNPPYRKIGTGRQAPNRERAQARHELAGGLADFLEAAAFCLGDGGRFFIVYLAERLADLLTQMRQVRLEPKRVRCVHGRIGDSARMVLVEGRKGGRAGLEIETPLFVFDGEAYSREVREMYGVEEGPAVD